MKNFKAALALVSTILLAACLAEAKLCDKCKDKSYTKDIGTCVECGGTTTSGAFKLCMGCSNKLKQCEHCRASLASATAPAGAAQDVDGIDAGKVLPEPLKMMDDPLSKDMPDEGNYKKGKWELDIKVNAKGTKSQGWTMTISYDGKELAEPANINDFVVTPWGKFYWFGQSSVQWGGHNWHISPNAPAKNTAGTLVAWPNYVAELRADTIRKKIEKEDLYLMLQCQRQQDKDKYLSLTVTTSTAPPAPKQNWLWSVVTKDQAGAIVESLKTCGFLAAAVGGPQKDPAGEDAGYRIVLDAGNNATLWLDMPINQALVSAIGQIGKAGGKEAQQATDQVLEKLKGLVKADKKEETK